MHFLLRNIFGPPRLRPRRRRRRQEGQTLVEYALLLALVAIVCIAAFALLSNQVVAVFSRITTLLDTSLTSSQSPGNN